MHVQPVYLDWCLDILVEKELTLNCSGNISLKLTSRELGHPVHGRYSLPSLQGAATWKLPENSPRNFLPMIFAKKQHLLRFTIFFSQATSSIVDWRKAGVGRGPWRPRNPSRPPSRASIGPSRISLSPESAGLERREGRRREGRPQEYRLLERSSNSTENTGVRSRARAHAHTQRHHVYAHTHT